MYDHVDRACEQWRREWPELDIAPLAVLARLARFANYADRALQAVLDPFKINHGEFDVLATLRRSGKPYQLTPKMLGHTLMLSSGAMTNRLDHLERAALIKRLPNPADRRGVLVQLTQAGADCVQTVLPLHMAAQAELLRGLDPAAQAALAAALRSILAPLEAAGA